MKEKVLIGLSGGVDSAVASYLLKKQGYDVTGCYMRNWDSFANNDFLGNPTVNNDVCPQEKDYHDAVIIAKTLGIPLMRIDFIKEYWDDVFTYFLEEYKKGRTPNPDILCNRYIKFSAFQDFAKKNGFDKIAMGHYAKKVIKDGKAYLHKPKDLAKDQTYFLSLVKEDQIAVSLFPMEDILKTEAREIVKELGLEELSQKHGSTGICFIGERHFKQFLTNYLPVTPGKIVDIKSKETLGTHSGVLFYTLGQRHGLNIGGVKGFVPGKWIVCQKDVKNNILYVTSEHDESYLLSDETLLTHLNWIPDVPKEPLKVFVKFRYRAPDVPCTLTYQNDEWRLKYNGEKAVTPGQFAAIYDEDGLLLGGGVIEKTYYQGQAKD